ncbi:MAG: hypothetical protein ABGY24_02340, partial [bacterium]
MTTTSGASTGTLGKSPAATPASAADTLITATHQLIKTSDGKDKLLATLQYTAMLLAGPAPATSALKRTQASITSARKVFRILKPLEMLMPIYTYVSSVVFWNTMGSQSAVRSLP